MANQIRVTPDELRSLSSNLRYCAESVSINKEQINSVLQRLNTSWSGAAIDHHVGQISMDIDNMRNLEEKLTELASIVEQAASTIEETDHVIASFFRL